MALCTRHEPASEIARNIGISRTVLYKWKDEIIGDEAYQSMCKHEKPSLTEERDTLREEVNRLNQEIRRQQMELDILKKAEEIIKKDQGISVSTLTNREKTQIADVLRGSYPLTDLLRVLVLARSSFFYHRAALRSGDKYAAVRIAITEIFNGNYRCYGYRRLHVCYDTKASDSLRRLYADLWWKNSLWSVETVGAAIAHTAEKSARHLTIFSPETLTRKSLIKNG